MKKRGVPELDERAVLLIFLSFVVSLLFFFDAAQQHSVTNQSERVLTHLMMQPESDLTVVVEQRVDDERLAQLAGMSYEELKRELEISADFTLFFEDSEGNVIPIGGTYCIGSPRASIAGISCGS